MDRESERCRVTKRPPEMVELERYDPEYYSFDESVGMKSARLGEFVDAGFALNAIRSLRVKLFRERAQLHHAAGWVKYLMAWRQANDEDRRAYERKALFHDCAKRRFSRIADAIERGEL